MDQVLALGFGDQRLEFGSRKSVDEASLRDNEKEDLSTGEDRELICLEDLSARLLRTRSVVDVVTREGK